MLLRARRLGALLERVPQRGRLVNEGDEALRVEVGVSDGGKQRLGYEQVGFRVRNAHLTALHAPERDAFQQPDEQILQIRHVGRFAADTLDRTALVLERFLTLVTEHFHHSASFV